MMATCPELEAWLDAHVRLPAGFAAELERQAARALAAPVPALAGRGIVTCGGGPVHGPNVVRLVQRLRAVGCTLPVQVWRLPGEDLDVATLAGMGASAAVGCPWEQIKPGYALKPIALLGCPWAEALYLDADQQPLRDPADVFGWPEYRAAGAVAWPDWVTIPPATWEAHGLAPHDGPLWETGQLVVDRRRHHAALQVARWLCNWDARSFRLTVGDCEAFQLAWAACGAAAWVVEHPAMWYADGRLVANRDRAGRPLFER